MSQSLPGVPYCEKHQGNHSHYAEENCELCIANQRIAELEADQRRLEWLISKGYAVRDSATGEGLQIVCSNSFAVVSATVTLDPRKAINAAMEASDE